MDYQQNNQQNTSEEEFFSLVDVWNMVLNYKQLIILSTVLGTAAAIVYILLATPTYKAQLLMVPAGSEGGSSMAGAIGQMQGIAGLAGLSLPGGGDGTSSVTERAILESRSFIGKYIKDNDLMPILFDEAWDEETKTWESGAPPSSWDAYLAFSNMLEVVKDRKTYLITVSLEWKNPNQAALWLNDLVRLLNEHIRQQKISETRASIQYLEQELARTSLVSPQTVLYSIIAEQEKNIMLANVREEYSMKVIDQAVPPQKPFSPQKRNALVTGFLIGFFTGLLTVLSLGIYRSTQSVSLEN